MCQEVESLGGGRERAGQVHGQVASPQAAKEATLSRRGVELELGSLEDWLQTEQMERKMGDSLLKWLGWGVHQAR